MKRVHFNRDKFCNSFNMILAFAVLFTIISTIVAGMRVHIANFPEYLGNNFDSIDYLKSNTDPNEFTFMVVGDTKGGTATFEAMLNIIDDDKPAFAVLLGDFVSHSKLISHKLFALEIGEYTKEFPMFLIPGNHDISVNSGFSLKDFENIYGPAQFSFTIGKSLFVFLNVIDPYGQTGQYIEFLEKIMSSQDEKMERVFVFTHIPPSGLNSSLICNGLAESEKFLQLAKRYKIDYVFSGDHHGYVKTERDGTTFVVTGGGGAKLRGKHGKFHHLVRMSVKDGNVAESIVVSEKHLETLELIERNMVVYIWPLITHNTISLVVTSVIFVSSVWLLITSLRRRKQLTKSK